MLLKHFDLVAIRVGDEEEAGQQYIAVLEFLLRQGRVAIGHQFGMALVGVVDHHGDMAVAVAMGVGLFAALVPGEFELCIAFVVKRHDQRVGGDAVDAHGART